MDEILKNNDKFETIKVLMEILCKELEISIDSDMNTIAMNLHRVHTDYYRSMAEYKELMKFGINRDIRKQSKPE